MYDPKKKDIDVISEEIRSKVEKEIPDHELDEANGGIHPMIGYPTPNGIKYPFED